MPGMTPAELLIDAFSRVRDGATRSWTVSREASSPTGPPPDANSIGWLVWHLARVQDDHVADVAGIEQVWTAQGFAERFGLPFDVSAIGFGHSSADVADVRADADLLREYLDAVTDADARLRDRRSTPTTSTASSTSAGTRPSRSGCGWSASSTTTCSTWARRPTSRGCWVAELSGQSSSDVRLPGSLVTGHCHAREAE